MLEIDHVVMAVRDLEAAAERLRTSFGLNALPGGTHPGGTRNWIVPLASLQYLELLGIADESTAAASAIGSWLLNELRRGDHLAAWAVRTDDLDAVAERVGRPPLEGSITMPDGSLGRWRTVLPDPADVGQFPFFIQYDGRDRASLARENYERAASPARPGEIRRIEVGTDAARLRHWLGGEDLPVAVVAGPPGIGAVAIESPSGQIVIR